MVHLIDTRTPTSSGLTTGELARLRRAVFWLAIPFLAGAVASLAIGAAVATPLFAGMEAFLCWCSIASIVEYVFFHLRMLGPGGRGIQQSVAQAATRTAPDREKRSADSDAASSGQLRDPLAMGALFRRHNRDRGGCGQLSCHQPALSRCSCCAPCRDRSLSFVRVRLLFLRQLRARGRSPRRFRVIRAVAGPGPHRFFCLFYQCGAGLSLHLHES